MPAHFLSYILESARLLSFTIRWLRYGDLPGFRTSPSQVLWLHFIICQAFMTVLHKFVGYTLGPSKAHINSSQIRWLHSRI